MNPYLVTVRTATACLIFSTRGRSSSDVAVLAAELLGDTPCGVTVRPA